MPPKFRKLNKVKGREARAERVLVDLLGGRPVQALAELIEDFGLVSFTALNADDRQNVAAVVRLADKACGYVYRADEMNDLIARAQADLDLAEMHELYRRKEK